MHSGSAREMRASETDRETVARWLAAAAGEGRITTDEMQDRLARVREARTYGDLEPLVRDLPNIEQPRVETVPETLRVAASLRTARMHGRWTVPPRVVASAGRGSVLLDFTEAAVEHDQVTVDARPNWRSVYLVIPDGYGVSTEETIPGTSDIRGAAAATSEGVPRIHVIARPGLGSVVIRRPRERRLLPWRRSGPTGAQRPSRSRS